MNLQAGYIPQNVVTEGFDAWLNSLFPSDISNPGMVSENPGALVYTGASTTTGDDEIRNMLYSFANIREAFLLRRLCKTESRTESIVHALVDNFLLNAYAHWNLSPEKRMEFIRTQASTFQSNAVISEKIGSLPFCSLPDQKDNEIFLSNRLKAEIARLMQELASRDATIQSQNDLLVTAAEQKSILEGTIRTIQDTQTTALLSMKENFEKRYTDLQNATDALIAEKNQDLYEKIQLLEAELIKVRVEQERELAKALQSSNIIEMQMKEKANAFKEVYEKDILLIKKDCERKLADKDEQVKILIDSKLDIVKSEFISKYKILQTKYEALKSKYSALSKTSEKREEEYKILALQNSELGQTKKNMAEGLELRDTELRTQKRLFDEARDRYMAKMSSLEQQLSSTALQLGTKTSEYETEVARLRAEKDIQCTNELAKLSKESDARYQQSISMIKSVCEAKIEEIKRNYKLDLQMRKR